MEFGTQLIGRTEKTLNRILEGLLAGPGLSERQWIALTLSVNGGSIERALHVSPDEAAALVAQLRARGLVDAEGVASERGREQYREVRAAIEQVTGRLWGDLPAADLAAAGRVLDTVLSRAQELLPA